MLALLIPGVGMGGGLAVAPDPNVPAEQTWTPPPRPALWSPPARGATWTPPARPAAWTAEDR